MSLFIASLNSGSNGNCYYIGNENEAVFIDAGISCRETERRMKRLSLDIKKVKAIFISHEHTDHISGITVLSKKYQLPVYITAATKKNSPVNIEPHLHKTFSTKKPENVGSIRVTAFPKFHDADDPHSFIVQQNDITVGVFTDIGRTCENLIHHFKKCNAAFLETNYDRDMLMNGSYPFHLKKRISGGHGHLSNDEALQIFLEHKPTEMTHLILSHLSQNNNNPTLVQKLFEPYNHLAKIIIASRHEETELFEITTGGNTGAAIVSKHKPKPVQLSMFE